MVEACICDWSPTTSGVLQESVVELLLFTLHSNNLNVNVDLIKMFAVLLIVSRVVLSYRMRGTVQKLLEMIPIDKISSHLEENGLRWASQHGFV